MKTKTPGRTTQRDKVETVNLVWQIFCEQSNRCDVLADAFVTNGQVQKVSSVNGELGGVHRNKGGVQILNLFAHPLHTL